ncbi:MAG: hypothetical protein GYB65_08675 [Chloroflexi bacterium]|nr:hypothetical protein [Chloroflexota bacterium]
MEFNFMKPGIWDGLVLATIFVGLALAILRLYADWMLHQHRQTQGDTQAPVSLGDSEQAPNLIENVEPFDPDQIQGE